MAIDASHRNDTAKACLAVLMVMYGLSMSHHHMMLTVMILTCHETVETQTFYLRFDCGIIACDCHLNAFIGF
ncbi:hypothetical protein OAN307_c37500 [Octadecabacter antarcticus 307]|uniref:Uncharacterized protein n=1 Tax=Octadecabacter antarcticus 307 TaxID=391626 RepID=M9RFJ5_9RHOB|nr:hypothetical protein OAN307_c37500 [Octadecabacter antarcticus 307]